VEVLPGCRGDPAPGARRLPRCHRAGSTVRRHRTRRVLVGHPGRNAPRLLRTDGPSTRHPGQHRSGRAPALHARQLFPWSGVRRRALSDQHVPRRRSRRPADAGRLSLLGPAPRTAATDDRRRVRPGASRRRPATALPRYRPFSADQRQILAERVQVQQLQLPRRQHGCRRGAGSHAAVGPRARSAAATCAVVRRTPPGRTARRSGRAGRDLRGGSVDLGAGRRCPGILDRSLDRRAPRPPARGPAHGSGGVPDGDHLRPGPAHAGGDRRELRDQTRAERAARCRSRFHSR